MVNLKQTSYRILAGTSQAYVLDLKDFSGDFSLKQELVFVLEQATNLNLKIVGFGELLVNLIIKIEFVGINVHAKMTGAFLLNQNSQVKIDVLQNHLLPDCQSWVQVRSVLDDFAQFDYVGKILIGPSAQNTIAHQENKNIVMSSGAVVRSEPSIEVLNTDVMCSHGSATGGLDYEQLIYLTSRGLDQQAATKILINSFLNVNICT